MLNFEPVGVDLNARRTHRLSISRDDRPRRADWEGGSGRVWCARTRAVGELKKSRRNRGALHGDFYVSEANVFANYAFAFASRLRFHSCPSRVQKTVKGLVALLIPKCRGIEMIALGSCRARDCVTIEQ